MKSLLAFATLLVTVGAQGLTDNCNRLQFTQCNNYLGQFWRQDTSNAWRQLTDLDRITQSLFTAPYSVDNFVAACNGYSSFYGCLGQQQIRDCLGTVGFVGSGLSLNDAYAYQGFLADWGFKCGAGFWTVYERKTLAACAANTYVNYQSDTSAALGTYITSTQQDPTNACNYAQTFMNSWQKIYQNGPCRTVNPTQAAWYGCQSAREWSNAQFRHCRHVTTCASPSTIETRTNAETGKLEYLTLPTHKIVDNHAEILEEAKWVSEQ
ncbi:unnamed protein product [Caenorhabditis angaria]|uniref:DUF19 domain-containing protein n=1 Tax=Caenorhabditis angaria TaxID=860376 RepID=A0A9P1INF8_9PELO|nr:unnamed protein product [Caenorhabditis angaria]